MKKHLLIHMVSLLTFCLLPLEAWSWGFFAHKQINRYAITTLPPDMFAFYKTHLTFLTEKSVNPDKRRYVVKDEAPKHFIDLEAYHASLLDEQNLLFDQAIAKYGANIVATHGMLPWTILNVQKQLTEAFKHKDIAKILKCSADLGHYIADAHVPLHTTQNYNRPSANLNTHLHTQEPYAFYAIFRSFFELISLGFVTFFLKNLIKSVL